MQPSRSGERHNLGAEVGVKLSHVVEEPKGIGSSMVDRYVNYISGLCQSQAAEHR